MAEGMRQYKFSCVIKEEMKAYLEPTEVELMEKAAASLRDRLLIRLLFRLGCRVSEALALTVDDLDFSRGTVTIEHLKRRMRLFCPKCKAGVSKTHRYCPRCGEELDQPGIGEKPHCRMRTLPVDDGTMGMLRDLSEIGTEASPNGCTLVFGISRQQAWRVVKDCATRAGLLPLINPETGRARGISPHRLRDAFAVHAVKINDSGDGLRLLQVHLGHASFDTTARYPKVAGEEHRDWYQSLWKSETT